MDPLELLKSLGISLADLAAAARFDAPLRALGERAYNFGFFQTLLRENPIPGLALPARVAYNVANYLAFQGNYLGMVAPGMTLPYQMAEVTMRRPSERTAEANYRYDVEITVTFPSSGERVPKYVSVDSPLPISPQEAEARAWEQFIRDIGFDTLPGGGGEPIEYFGPDANLVGFYRLAGS